MSQSATHSATIRTAIAAALIALAVHLAQSQDALRDFSRPVVIAVLHVLGIGATDHGEMIAVGKLEVPWTRDCAGINLLLILLALAVWVNRQERPGPVFWLRLGLMIPAALAANVLRVLTLITYRTIAFPAVESPQTHYFMGLVWLSPFVALITPRGNRPRSLSFIETLHAASVVALLAPMSGTPNGSLITVAAVIALSQCRAQPVLHRLGIAATALWVLGGAAIAYCSMESFWLPWLLLCPVVAPAEWVCSVGGILVIACTHSVLAMQTWSMVFGGIAIALAARTFLRPANDYCAPTPANKWLAQIALRSATLACFSLPFIASTLLAIGDIKWTPPAQVESRPIGNDGFELLLPGQSKDIGLICYAASSRDRHHTIQVCLKYRGMDLSPVPKSPSVYSDGTHWLREFFIINQTLLPDYSDYLRETFRPWASPGVHVIFIADKASSTSETFDQTCTKLAGQLLAACMAPPSKTPSIASSQP